MTAAEFQDAGRLSRKRLTGLWPSGSIGKPINDPTGASRGTSCGHPPPRCALRPLESASRVAACRDSQYRRPAAGSLRSMVSAGRRPARGARRAAFPSHGGFFVSPSSLVRAIPPEVCPRFIGPAAGVHKVLRTLQSFRSTFPLPLVPPSSGRELTKTVKKKTKAHCR